MTIYKVLSERGTSCHGGNCQWSLPTQNSDGTWTPGEWMPDIEGALVACQNGYHLCEDAQVLDWSWKLWASSPSSTGYHLCEDAQVLDWLNESIYEAEFDGECMESCDKIVVRRARLLRRINWDEAIARRFARWCALQVIELWSAPSIVREYLETGDETIRAAAWTAARAAARDAQYEQFLKLTVSGEA